jgi:hypothetical protein
MRRPVLHLALTLVACSGGPAGADASVDVIGTDAPADQSGAGDSGADGAGACNPAAVAFPRGGTLAPADICALTLLEPTPTLPCVVFVNAR